MLAGYLPEAAHFIRMARDVGIALPVLAGDALDSMELVTLAGEAAEGTHVVSVYHEDAPYPDTKAFSAAFKKRFNAGANYGAAQGYDAMRLIAYAIEQAGTTVPDEVADVLRKTRDWMGVTGLHTFTETGDVMKPIVLKVVRDGQFHQCADPAGTHP